MLRVCEGRVLFGVGFIFIIFVVDLGSIVVIGLVFVVLAFTPSGATQVRMGARTTTRFSRQRLRRLCELKSGGKLKVPEWMDEAWKTGDKTALAQTYKNVGFEKDWFGLKKSWFMLTLGLAHL